MRKNHFTKHYDRNLEKIIASFSDRPIRWSEVETQLNTRFKRSQHSVATIRTRWRTLQKKAKQELLKRITQKDGFEAWFEKFLAGVKKLREQVKTAESKIDDLNKRNKKLEEERDDAIKALEDHLDKDERMRSKAKKLGDAALVVNSD